MKNKILSGIVALSIVISALPVTTKAAVKGDITKQEYIYNISGSGGEKLITTDHIFLPWHSRKPAVPRVLSFQM